MQELAGPEHYLFTTADLRGVPSAISGDMAVVLSRAQKAGLLKRICRGVYLYPRVEFQRGLVLFHAAAILRAHEFNYISLETALSDAGVIAQVPWDWITLMSSGRSSVINCGEFGHIEFVHTVRRPDALADSLAYDASCRLWRASPALALRDMRATRRKKDLINPEALHELV